MLFERTTLFTHLIHIVSEDHIMGIAHRDEGAVTRIAGFDELRPFLKDGLAHIDGDAFHDTIVDQQTEYLDAREGQQTDLCQSGQSALKEIFSDTP